MPEVPVRVMALPNEHWLVTDWVRESKLEASADFAYGSSQHQTGK